MSEQAADALETEPSALFEAEIRPQAEVKTRVKAQKQILGGITGFVNC
jgi:hypothetical protein